MKKNNFSLLLMFFISIYAGASMTKKLPEHPGYIVTVEEPGGVETKKSIKEIPLNHQYVFLKNGKEVTSQTDADTIIPIVKVKVLRSTDRKKIIEIQEIGPDGTSLRRT